MSKSIEHAVEKHQLTNSDEVELTCPCGWKATATDERFISVIEDRHLRIHNVNQKGA